MKNKNKIVCEITSESSEAINENMKCQNKLKLISLNCKDENKIDNCYFGDEGFCEIFNGAMYLKNLESLCLHGNKE